MVVCRFADVKGERAINKKCPRDRISQAATNLRFQHLLGQLI